MKLNSSLFNIKYINEIWKDIDNLSKYQISNKGRVKNKITGRILSNYNLCKGYKGITLCGFRYKIHRLVAKAFIPNPNNLPFINHKDENPANNNVENLEWCDNKYNCTYGSTQRRRVETISKGKVIEYDSNGNVLNIYPSKNYLNDIGKSNVRAALDRNTYNRYYYGSYWFSEYETFDANRKKLQKRYNVLDKNNNIIFTGGTTAIAHFLRTTKNTIVGRIKCNKMFNEYKFKLV